MGWEKLPGGAGHRSALAPARAVHHQRRLVRDDQRRLPHAVLKTFLVPDALQWLVVLAVVGLVVVVVLRIRVGIWLGLVAFTMAVGFIVAPESRLWNARLLPFYYLALFLLAALGIGELARAVVVLASPDPERPNAALDLALKTGVTAVALGVVVVMVGLPLKALPGEIDATPDSSTGSRSTLGIVAVDHGSQPGARLGAVELHGLREEAGVSRVLRLHEHDGAGRPRARLRPADVGVRRRRSSATARRWRRCSCRSSPTAASARWRACTSSRRRPRRSTSSTSASCRTKCSCAQRNLPYGGARHRQGVEHLQMLGVQYYTASTAPAKAAGRREP